MPANKRLMAQCQCGLIWQLGLMPMDAAEARSAIHQPCPLCADRGSRRFCWIATTATNVLCFPKKDRLQ